MVMLCDGRIVCGCADPYGKRVSATQTPNQSPRMNRRAGIRTAARPQCRRLEVLRRLPSRAPPGEEAPPRRNRRGGAGASSPLYIGARPPGCFRARRPAARRRRASPRPQRRHTRFRAFPARDRRGRPSLVRVDFLNCGEPSFASARSNVRIHQAQLRHIYSTRARTASHSPRSRRVGWCAQVSTKSPSGSTARRPRPKPIPQARRRQQGRPQPEAVADEKRGAGRDPAVYQLRYILFV